MRATRRSLLAGAGALALAAAGDATAQMLRPSFDVPQGAGLRRRAAQNGLLYGAATGTYQLGQDDFAGALARESAILVAEYEMKRNVLEPSRGTFDFSGADKLHAFADWHGMLFRGHTLVWHHANPDWLDDAAIAARDEKLITDYVAKVAGHFRGRMHSWDVVNEAINPADGRADALRATPWLKAFGPHYIDLAFHAAQQADPHALLVYNDWGFEEAGRDHDRFRAATLDFLEAALARGVPIQALGLQGHLAAFGAGVEQKKLGQVLDRVKAMGLQILVTEHDVDDSGGPSDIAARDRAVADASRRFLDVVVSNSATLAVLTWGLSDRFLDAPGWRAKLSGYRPRMLPLDDALARTPMWSAMAKTFAPDMRG